MSETGSVTSELLWWSALGTALIDAPLLVAAVRWVSSDLFRKLMWYLAGGAFVVYAALWGVLGSVLYWDSVYHAIFPAWARWLLGPFYGLLFTGVALAFWSLSRRAARWQVLWFCLLGGLVSIVGHSIGISRGVLRVPLLAEASAASALTFGVFEFIFYWCVIVALGAAGRWIGLRVRPGGTPYPMPPQIPVNKGG